MGAQERIGNDFPIRNCDSFAPCFSMGFWRQSKWLSSTASPWAAGWRSNSCA